MEKINLEDRLMDYSFQNNKDFKEKKVFVVICNGYTSEQIRREYEEKVLKNRLSPEIKIEWVFPKEKKPFEFRLATGTKVFLYRSENIEDGQILISHYADHK